MTDPALLSAVRWRTVYEVVRDHTPNRLQIFAAAASVTPAGTVDMPHLLAGLVARAAPWQVHGALKAATWAMPPDDLDRLTRWTCATATAYFGRMAPRPDRPPTQPPEGDGWSGLHLSADLPTLPLQPLAEAIAGTQPCRRLAVETAALPGLNGTYRREPAGGLIILNPAAIATAGRTLADTFAHELAHALDPSTVPLPEAEAERFANRLGPLLLEHAPTTLTDVDPLIDQALTARPHQPDDTALDELLDQITALDTWSRLDLQPADRTRRP